MDRFFRAIRLRVGKSPCVTGGFAVRISRKPPPASGPLPSPLQCRSLIFRRKSAMGLIKTPDRPCGSAGGLFRGYIRRARGRLRASEVLPESPRSPLPAASTPTSRHPPETRAFNIDAPPEQAETVSGCSDCVCEAQRPREGPHQGTTNQGTAKPCGGCCPFAVRPMQIMHR